jgi:hypothetical protein
MKPPSWLKTLRIKKSAKGIRWVFQIGKAIKPMGNK